MSNFDADKLKNKKIIFASALILLMALGGIAAPLLSTVKAQALSTIPTELFMSVAPNPIGVGQNTSATVWLSVPPPLISFTAYYAWKFTVNVMKPDGNNVTLGPFESSPNGGYFITYTPTTVGNYTFQAYFPLTTVTIPPALAGVTSMNPGTYTYPAAESKAITLTVQKQPIQAWPQTPLPTNYWSFPISAENQNWYTIAGNWLYTPWGIVLSSRASPFTTAPNTAHILWTKPLTFGGISGGQYSSGNTPPGTTTPYKTTDWGVNYYTGLLYQEILQPIIISGYLYYNIFPAGSGLPGVTCVNLRTGQLVWSNASMPQLVCGQVLTFQAGDQSGSLAYLWTTIPDGTIWQMWDAFTGRLLTTFTNIPTVPGYLGYPGPVGFTLTESDMYGPNGEILVYVYDSTEGYIAMWNSTLAVLAGQTQFSAQQYTPWSIPVRDWSSGIQWNVTIPPTEGNPAQNIVDLTDGVMVAEGCSYAETSNPVFEDYGYSTITGAQLWAQNRTNVGWGSSGPATPGLLEYGNSYCYGDGYYAFYQRETMQWHVININTGVQAWVSPPLSQYTNSDYSYYDWGSQICNGILYTDGYSGDVVAFNVTTGQHLWTFSQPNSGLQTPFGSWPSFGGAGIVADGKLYWGVTQHSPGTPLLRGYNLYCINFTTGAEIWQLPGFFPSSSIAIADGELVGYAGYDNQIYAFGKGQSATTVTTAPTIGSSTQVLITGAVTDQSPGTTAYGPAAGTPAIADAYMSAWMAYLYQQQPEPMNATGVPVTLTDIDPNGNTYTIGTTTSNINGNYKYTFTPNVPGTYTIIATFGGSNSYYSSSAETYFNFVPPASTAAPTPTPTSVANMYFVPAIAGLFVLIIIVAIVLALLMLRKRP